MTSKDNLAENSSLTAARFTGVLLGLREAISGEGQIPKLTDLITKEDVPPSDPSQLEKVAVAHALGSVSIFGFQDLVDNF
jgi:hypothetical protein